MAHKKPSIFSMKLASGTKGPVMNAWGIHHSIVTANGWDNSRSWYYLHSHKNEFELGINAAGEFVLISEATPRDQDGDPVGAMYAAVNDESLIVAADAFSNLIRAARLARRLAA